ncbi:MFS transporter [Sphingomonas cavernae]|uniref:MFS transporter n=1 Tax=Sphingomonas cavernae TaxID=2320861 RepID=A0A418WPF6_9SPHN|nr:MFS transporter [Sphingomonas cavernae]RJF93100.1 MFS transporter [Sphingomonas cavernae]
MATGLSRAGFAALVATTLATVIGNTGLISVMPAIGREIGISDFLIASVFSLSALMWAISSPWWAALSDRRGRKPFILLGLAGFVFSMIGCGLVVLAGLEGLAAPFVIFLAFLLIRSSYGMFGSASATASQAYVAERTTGEHRVRAIAALGGALSLGTILGPALAPFLILPPAGLAGPMFIFALGGVAIIAAVAAVLPADTRAAQAVAHDAPGMTGREIWHHGAVRPFLVYGFIVSSAQAANTYTLGFLVIDRLGLPPIEAQGAIGMAMVAGAVAGLVAQWGFVGMAGMMPRALLRWGAALALIGNVLIVALPGYAALVAAFALVNLGYGLARPGFTAGASLAAPDAGQGAVAGAISSIAGAAIVVPPVLAVAMYQLFPAAPFIVLAGLMAASLIYALVTPALAETGARKPAIVSCER